MYGSIFPGPAITVLQLIPKTIHATGDVVLTVRHDRTVKPDTTSAIHLFLQFYFIHFSQKKIYKNIFFFLIKKKIIIIKMNWCRDFLMARGDAESKYLTGAPWAPARGPSRGPVHPRLRMKIVGWRSGGRWAESGPAVRRVQLWLSTFAWEREDRTGRVVETVHAAWSFVSLAKGTGPLLWGFRVRATRLGSPRGTPTGPQPWDHITVTDSPE